MSVAQPTNHVSYISDALATTKQRTNGQCLSRTHHLPELRSTHHLILRVQVKFRFEMQYALENRHPTFADDSKLATNEINRERTSMNHAYVLVDGSKRHLRLLHQTNP